MTYFALATAGLLIPLNAMFSGLGVVLDRQHGAMPELLVAPIRRSSIVVGNLPRRLAITAFQIVVLIARGRAAGRRRSSWLPARLVRRRRRPADRRDVLGIAEILATEAPEPRGLHRGAPGGRDRAVLLRRLAVPHLRAAGLAGGVGKALPLTHALALFRYGLTDPGHGRLHDIWGQSNDNQMAALSLAVLALYALVITVGAVRLFAKASTK